MSIESMMLSIWFSAIPFSFCLQSSPASRSFFSESALRIRWLKYWSFSFSLSPLPKIIQGWYLLELAGLTSLQSKGLSRVFSTPQFESVNSSALNLLMGEVSHLYTTPGKTIAWLYGPLSAKWCLFFLIILSMFVIVFLIAHTKKRKYYSYLRTLQQTVAYIIDKWVKFQCVYYFTFILLIKEKYQPTFILQLHWFISWSYKLARGWEKSTKILWELIGYMDITIMNIFYYCRLCASYPLL